MGKLEMDAEELLSAVVSQCGLTATLRLLQDVAWKNADKRLNSDEFPNRASVWTQAARRLERVARFTEESGI